MFVESNELLRFNSHSFKWKMLVDNLIIILFIITLFTFISPAHAFSVRSQIINNSQILNEYQIDNIKAELSSLRKISLIIVINQAGNRCTDDYAYCTAKSLCQEIFSRNDEGIIVAYCSSLEGYKIGIYYQGNFDIDTRQLKEKIVSEYGLYYTDSLWIECSCIQCINKINEFLNSSEEQTVEIPQQEQIAPKKTIFWKIFGKYIIISFIILSVFVAGIIIAFIIYRKHHKQIDKDIEYWFHNKEG